ncbi:MAG: SHOCT domain-containing protein [bacterium]
MRFYFLSSRKRASGHIEIVIALIVAGVGVAWFLWGRPSGGATGYANEASTAGAWGGIPIGLVSVAAVSLFGMGVLTGLLLHLLSAMKRQHNKRPFSFSCFLPTKANRAIVFLDGLQKMRDAGLISKQEYEAKRTHFLSKL